jgi:hypothetical protein
MLYSKSLFISVFLVCLLGFVRIAPAQSAADEVAAIPGAWNLQLGPDPSKITFLWNFNNSNHLVIYDVNDKTIRLFPQDENSSITSFNWLTENKIACAVRQGTDNVQLVVMDTGTGARITADIGPCRNVSLFPTRNATAFPVGVVPQDASVDVAPRYQYDSWDMPAHPDLYSVDVATGKTSLLIKNPGNITGWTCEENGTPVFAAGVDSEKMLFYMIDRVDKGLRLMASMDGGAAKCDFYSNSARHDRKYMRSNLNSNTVSHYELMPDGTQRLIYGNEKFDSNGSCFHNSGKPLAFTYIADKTEYHFIGEDDSIIRRIVAYFKDKDITLISLDKDDRAAIVGVSDIGGRQKPTITTISGTPPFYYAWSGNRILRRVAFERNPSRSRRATAWISPDMSPIPEAKRTPSSRRSFWSMEGLGRAIMPGPTRPLVCWPIGAPPWSGLIFADRVVLERRSWTPVTSNGGRPCKMIWRTA